MKLVRASRTRRCEAEDSGHPSNFTAAAATDAATDAATAAVVEKLGPRDLAYRAGSYPAVVIAVGLTAVF